MGKRTFGQSRGERKVGLVEKQWRWNQMRVDWITYQTPFKKKSVTPRIAKAKVIVELSWSTFLVVVTQVSPYMEDKT